MTGKVDHSEQKVADLGTGGGTIAGSELGLDLVRLLADLGEHRERVVPIEADLARLGLQFERAGKGRERDRNAGKRACGFRAAEPIVLLRALRPFDAFPQALDRLRRKTSRLAEYVRMTAHELFAEALDDVGKVEGPLLLRHAGMEDDLEQEIAQFVAQVIEIAARNGVGDLVRLLDGVRRDRFKGLLQVPGATSAGRAQRRHDLEQPGDVAGRGHRRRGDKGVDDDGPYSAGRYLSRISAICPEAASAGLKAPGRIAQAVPLVAGPFGLTAGFEQEPAALFSFVDEILQKAGGGYVLVLVGDLVGLAHVADLGLVVVHELQQHVDGGNVVLVVVLDSLQLRDLADRPDRGAADLAGPLGCWRRAGRL